MTLFRQSINTFTRDFGDFGFMVHQYAKNSHIFEGIDHQLLNVLSQTPRTWQSALAESKAMLPDVNAQKVEREFSELMRRLEAEKLLDCTGQVVRLVIDGHEALPGCQEKR